MWFTSVEEWASEPGRTWLDFETAFLKRFKPANYDEWLEQTVRSIRQLPDEDVATYGSRFRVLHGRLDTSGPSIDSLRYAWIHGLRHEDWRTAILAAGPKTFDDALERALGVEHGMTMMSMSSAMAPVFEMPNTKGVGRARVPFGDVGNAQKLTEVFSQLCSIVEAKGVVPRTNEHPQRTNHQPPPRRIEGECREPQPRVQGNGGLGNNTWRGPHGPICFRCRMPGHIAQHCLRGQPIPAPGRQEETPQEHQADVYALHKKRMKQKRRGDSDPGEGGQTRRRKKRTPRHIKLMKKQGVEPYSICQDLA